MSGPQPMCICATLAMLRMLCDPTAFVFQMFDFTFFICKGKVDCFDGHTMDYSSSSMMALPLFKVFASAKTAKAHERYFWELDAVCQNEGLEYSWGEGCSVQMAVIDMHQGQALGLLRYLIRKYSNETGPQIFLSVLRACRTHHRDIPRKAINHSKLDKEQTDEAYRLYGVITALQSTRPQVDQAFALLASISEPLKRSVEFLTCSINRSFISY